MALWALTLAIIGLIAHAGGAPYPTSAKVTPVATANRLQGNFQSGRNLTGLANPVNHVTGEKVHSAAVARFDNSNVHDGIGGGSDTYTTYKGNGGIAAGWPTRAKWVSFENMFNNNKKLMSSSCAQYGQTNDNSDEINNIRKAIQKVADETGVDHRLILAVMLQESSGCVRAPTSNYGVRNPGLMQSHNGGGTCNSDITGQVQSPCPAGVITQMIREGAGGTDSGDGLANCINQSGRSNDADFYRAARIYNSGSVASSGRLECGIATHCYASDIANRLTGWVSAPRGCTCDSNPSSCPC